MNLLGGKKDSSSKDGKTTTSSNDSSLNTSAVSNQSTGSNKQDEPKKEEQSPTKISKPLPETNKETQNKEPASPNKGNNVPIGIENRNYRIIIYIIN